MEEYYKNNPKKIGVLLINLGTPDHATTASVKIYLKEFLSDTRVIEAPKILWWFLLRLVILPFRSHKSAKNYAKIWDTHHNKSPLFVMTKELSEKLHDHMHSPTLMIDYAMRYGNPSIEKIMQNMLENHCHKILIVPLYPQYSATTYASVADKVFEVMGKLRFQPTLRFLPPYFDNEHYINAVSTLLQTGIAQHQYDKIVMLFHGLPQEYFDKGDPYFCHCSKTARLIREKLSIPKEQFVMAFQSRFGPKKWLQPYAEETIINLAKNGTKKIIVLSPGFQVDCIETLEEIDIGLRESFLDNGGEEFIYIPCLNANEHSVTMMQHLIHNELKGWV